MSEGQQCVAHRPDSPDSVNVGDQGGIKLGRLDQINVHKQRLETVFAENK